jgi:clan AA aspartic protease
VKAWVDEENRALVELSLARHAESTRNAVSAWIDTAFDGHLVLPRSQIEELGLDVIADTEAILADGSKTQLRCYYCVVEWLSGIVPVQVIENEGQLPLIGTGLLAQVDLRINYRTRVCTLT